MGSDPAGALQTLHSVSGCGSPLGEVFTDTSVTFYSGPGSLQYWCGYAFIHLAFLISVLLEHQL